MKKRTYHYIYCIVLSVILICIAGYVLWPRGNSAAPELSSRSPGVASAAEVSSALSATGTSSQTYTDELLGFSFGYPDGFTDEASGAGSDRVVVMSSRSGDQMFQLEVTPWNDPEHRVTVERIRRDAPDVEIRDPQAVSVAGQVRGVSFISSTPEISGDVRQIWFILEGNLYRYTSPIASDAAVEFAALSTLPRR